jgi:hypothetical protein
MAQEGIDLATLATILGHNSIRMVERYVHPTDEHRKSATLRYEACQMALSQSGPVEKPNLSESSIILLCPQVPNERCA